MEYNNFTLMGSYYNISLNLRNTLTNWLTISLTRKLFMRITFLSWAMLYFSLASCVFFSYMLFWMLAHWAIYRRSKSKFLTCTETLPCKAKHHVSLAKHALHRVYIIHLSICHHMQASILSSIYWPYGNGWTPRFYYRLVKCKDS